MSFTEDFTFPLSKVGNSFLGTPTILVATNLVSTSTLKVKISCHSQRQNQRNTNHLMNSRTKDWLGFSLKHFSSSLKGNHLLSTMKTHTPRNAPRNTNSNFGKLVHNRPVISFSSSTDTSETKPLTFRHPETNRVSTTKTSKQPYFSTMSQRFTSRNRSFVDKTDWELFVSDKVQISSVSTKSSKTNGRIHNSQKYFPESIQTDSINLVTTDVIAVDQNNTNGNGTGKTNVKLRKATIEDYWSLIIVVILVTLTIIFSIVSFGWHLRRK